MVEQTDHPFPLVISPQVDLMKSRAVDFLGAARHELIPLTGVPRSGRHYLIRPYLPYPRIVLLPRRLNSR